MVKRKNLCIDCGKSYMKKGRGGGLRCKPCQIKHKSETTGQNNEVQRLKRVEK
jgi:tRNA(Ile2) C34 agmatinyltransferase TiaS